MYFLYCDTLKKYTTTVGTITLNHTVTENICDVWGNIVGYPRLIVDSCRQIKGISGFFLLYDYHKKLSDIPDSIVIMIII